ncbi:MAG: hypothetical protein K0Q79_2785 [Flavipsychrobacter sp.]|nr:hypothetical protein [Flavipsychrobacter sp.]
MKFILLTGLWLIAYNAGAQNDITRQNLKGRVKSVTQCQYPVARNGVIDSFNALVYVFRYLENGNQYEDDDYVGGSLYGNHGRLEHKRLYKYDETGRQTEVEEYKPDGKLHQRVVYKYDEQGNRIERCNYDPKGELWHRSVFSYDEKGNRTECSKHDAHGELREHYTYSYDAKGRLAMEQHMVVSRSKIEAKDKDKPPFSAANAERMMDYVRTFTYDDSGKLVGQMDNMSNFRVPFEVSYFYEHYDATGNWLRQVRVENKRKVSITDRLIEYY